MLACAIGALYTPGAGPRQRVLVCATIFLATAALFWSGTRAGVLGMAGGVAVLLATVRTLPPARILILAGIAAALGIIASRFWLPPDAAFGLLRRAGEQGSGDLESFSSGRTIVWASMMKAFAGSPLFGVGEGAVHWLAAIGKDRHVQPHNSVVQMLSSWGLIAGTAASYLLARLLFAIHRMARRGMWAIPLVLMLDCLLVMSLADGVLYFSRFIMWFAGGGGIALALGFQDQSVANASKVAGSAGRRARA